MWIKKSDWELKKNIVKAQEELIKKQDERIEALEKMTQIYDKHYESMSKLCKEVAAQNDRLLARIEELETKNDLAEEN